MTTEKRVLYFFILPILAVLSYPPRFLLAGWLAIPIAVALFSVFGWFLWHGRSTALTLSIFLQGLNVIIRIMMFFPRLVLPTGQVDMMTMLFNLAGLFLSFYLMLRLDRVDVRATMVA